MLVERLMNKLGKDINSSILWAKLKTLYNLPALDNLEPNPIDFEEEIDFELPDSYLNHKTNVDSGDDFDEEMEIKSENGSKSSEIPTSATTTNVPTGSTNTLTVVKETVEMTRTRNSTPARQLQETSGNNVGNESNLSTGSSSSTFKRTQPKRTRASTSSANDTPSSSPSTPTPGMKRRRI